jgi:nitrate reductase gamma subunit
MSAITVIFALLLYAAAAVLVVGVGRRIVQYARTPAPLKIPLMPAPLTRRGVVLRMLREVVLFESLFKSNMWIWLFGWIFHAAMLLAFFRHLRYAVEPVWGWVALIQPFGTYAGFAMLAGLIGLLARRFLVERVRYITSPSDILFLVLLIAIAASGLGMRYIAPTDIIALKAFVLGLFYFDWQPLPGDVALLIHLGLVAALMLVFPFSKLLHAPGLFFSPSRTQIDDSWEKQHDPASISRARGGSHG